MRNAHCGPMHAHVSNALNGLALGQFSLLRQVARLRELAGDAFRLSEIMHRADARRTLVEAAVSYAEAADELERDFYPASRRH